MVNRYLDIKLLGEEYEDLFMNEHAIPIFETHPEEIYYEPKSNIFINIRWIFILFKKGLIA